MGVGRGFVALVERLIELEGRDGELELEEAIERTALHKRLIALLSQPSEGRPEERRESLRVPGDMRVRLVGGGRELDGRRIDLGEGGVQVLATSLPQVDTLDVELLVEPLATDEQPQRARARATWTRSQPDGVAVGRAFIAQPDGHRRRMRRLVLSVLKRLERV